jgi:hypothetical protein
MLSIYLILPAALSPGVYLASNRNEYQTQLKSHRHLSAEREDNVGSSTSHSPTALHGLLQGDLYFLYVDYVPASQETHLWTSTTYYGDSFSFLYVDDIRTSQATHLEISMSCYGGRFPFLCVHYVRTS